MQNELTLQQEIDDTEKVLPKTREWLKNRSTPQNVNPAFDESVLKAAGRAAQIEQKSVIIASQLLDAVMVAYDEDKPNKALVPVFIQHITEAIATARAEGAAEERNLFKEFVKRQFGFKHYKYDKNSIETIIREYDNYLQALTTKEK